MKLKFLALFFLISLFLVNINDVFAAQAPFRPDCVGIEGKFTARDWKGGAIQVGCAGDDGGNLPPNSPRRCDGEIKTVRPGQKFRLTQCSCFGKKGCLVVGKELDKVKKPDGTKEIRVVKRIQDTNAF